MLRRLVNLPFSLATRAARAYQEREDTRTKARHGVVDDPGKIPLSDRVGNAGDTGAVDPASCRIAVAELRRRLAAGEVFAWVDVRAVASDLPAGATHMPLAEANMRVSELPTDEPVLVVCADGRESARAATFFRERGMEETWWLAGGLAAWRKDA